MLREDAMPAAAGTLVRVAKIPARPLGLAAVRLLARMDGAGPGGLLHVAVGERRAEQMAAVLKALRPDLDVLLLPPWDCLPYDRASPSLAAQGRRLSALRRLTQQGAGARLVVTTPDALVQRLPPREIFERATFLAEVGRPAALPDLEAFLRRAGYVLDERVDEPGEAAIRGEVVDLYPAGAATPYRLEHAEGRITAIRRYDPVTQRSVEEVEALTLGPASEVILPAAGEGEPEQRFPGIEHWLPDFYPRLETLFDYLPDAALALDPNAEARLAGLVGQIAEAYESRVQLRGGAPAGRAAVTPPRLYLEAGEWSDLLAGRPVTRLEPVPEDADPGVPSFVTQRGAARAFAAFLRQEAEAGRRLVLAAATDRDIGRLARRSEQALGRPPDPAEDWRAVEAAPAGAVLTLRADLDRGFVLREEGIVLVAAPDLLGSRAESPEGAPSAAPALPIGEVEFRLEDAVIHMDHGMAVLKDLETVSSDGAAQETIRLEYAGEAVLMVPVEDVAKIWRYGSEAEAVSLDRLDTDAWAKRRAKVEAELEETARSLVGLARAREATAAPKLTPPERDYERFVARFPFTETADQARAIEDALRDLASGRPMDRLVCGDVGFGKTEVALRAAAAAALAGAQVAVVAPTTVLVRQHVQSFRRRFAGLGIEVAHLSRLVKPAETKAVKQGLAEGRIRVVIGTQALAGKGVTFQNLGLLVVDEEQRFGARHKAKLRDLARGVHVLTLTATPIPRTLQSAMVGLQDLSVIATPPARRQPIRTFLAPFDRASVREALLRERRRGGQSFVVCPRIQDIEPLAASLRELVPELSVEVAHGKMPADELDDAMVRFAEGEGDVLLATNIIESGLDVPRANTMLVWRADRFGLSQLHQLRGRVGRGRVQGIAYLMTDPQARISPATEKRLRTLEALDRLGAGFAISARDLDLRGAGDLLGEEQAGHVKLIGVGLYQHLLGRALRAARGELLEEDWTPEIRIGAAALIPEGYVPEAEVRLNLYSRVATLASAEEIDALAEEIEDRFGPMPEEVRELLGVARLKRQCRAAGVAKLDAGPQALALTFRPGALHGPAPRLAVEALGDEVAWSGERLLYRHPTESFEERERLASELLERLAGS